MKKLITMLLLTALSFTAVTQAQTKKSAKTSTTATSHVKKDGTPDKRYKENKVPLKKDGTPDMRYKVNKKKP